MKVKLIFDVYFRNDRGRYWERQVWAGLMPDKETPAEYDPFALIMEYENGAEHILFRVDEVKEDEVIYRPMPLHNSDAFLKSLPGWGFKLEPVAEVTKVGE